MMRKFIKNLAVLSCVTLTLAALGGLTACGNGATESGYSYDLVEPQNTYTFENPTKKLAVCDDDMTIDGDFSEHRWQNASWLKATDYESDERYADIAFTSVTTAKGTYFAMEVVEHGNRIWMNSYRKSWINSGIQMYFSYADEPDNSSRIFEFDFECNGEYEGRIRFFDNYSVIKGPTDVMPLAAGVPIGEDFNTPKCKGYKVEAFFPVEYFKLCGYDIENWEESEFGINPVHTWSLSQFGNDDDMDRKWSNWADVQFSMGNWNSPKNWFKFDKDGIIAHRWDCDISGTGKGEVTDVNNSDLVLDKAPTIIKVIPVNGSTITSFKVNGENCLDNLIKCGNYYIYSTNQKIDLHLEVEFTK